MVRETLNGREKDRKVRERKKCWRKHVKDFTVGETFKTRGIERVCDILMGTRLTKFHWNV